MIKFERGKGPKATMSIGLEANAKVIDGLCEFWYERGIGGNGAYMTGERKTRSLSDRETISVLMGIEAGEFNPELYDYVWMTGDGVMDWPKKEPLGPLKGTYVKFRDHNYFIPEEFIYKERDRLNDILGTLNRMGH